MEEKVGNETGLVDWSSILWEGLCQTSTVIRVLHKQCYQQLVGTITTLRLYTSTHQRSCSFHPCQFRILEYMQ